MAISRKEALKTMNGLVPQVERHLAKIATQPGHSSIPHWRHEVRIWLQQMQKVLPHVGKKTAAAWQERIQEYEAALGS
jgi:hypothetical protein